MEELADLLDDALELSDDDGRVVAPASVQADVAATSDRVLSAAGQNSVGLTRRAIVDLSSSSGDESAAEQVPKQPAVAVPPRRTMTPLCPNLELSRRQSS